jgi:hypothetical protein
MLGREVLMPKKRFGAEQIATLLRQIEVSIAQANCAIGLPSRRDAAPELGDERSTA